MTFKTWLEGLEEYEPFRSKVEDKAKEREFPFENWWPAGQDRIVLPFEKKDEQSNAKTDIEELLADFKGLPAKGLPAAPKYNLVDYKAGLAQPEGKKNLYKIMRILDAMHETEDKKIADQLAANEISPPKAAEERKSWRKFFTELKNEFMNDPTRTAKGSGLKVVISKNIHDIASMSTGRGWTSCMHLVTGLHKKDPFCEVRNGGFIAYLVKDGDEDVKSPVARLHIRRFDNPKGQSIAVPEEEVYGADTPYLINFMKDWLETKQGKIKAGLYARRGGRYSDTFPNIKSVLVPNETDPNYYERYFKKWIRLDMDDRVRGPRRQLIKKMISNLVKFSDPSKIDTEIAKQLGAILFPDVYGDQDFPRINPLVDFGVCQFMRHFPQTVTKEIVDKLIDEVKTKKQNSRTSSFQRDCAVLLLKDFSHFVDEEQKKYLRPEWTSLIGRNFDAKLVKQAGEQAADSIDSELSFENLSQFPVLSDENVRPTIRYWHNLKNKISDILHLIGFVKPMKPETARSILHFYNEVLPKIDKIMQDKVKKFSSDLDKVDKDEAQRFRLAIEKDVSSVFAHTQADFPQVMRFYNQIMPRVMDHGGFFASNSLGSLLSVMGNNATPFLPLLRNLIHEYEKLKSELGSNPELNYVSEKEIDGNIEKLNYIIDSIETGDRSKKYSASPESYSFKAEKVAVPRALKASGYA